jgi:hypothetical protein
MIGMGTLGVGEGEKGLFLPLYVYSVCTDGCIAYMVCF